MDDYETPQWILDIAFPEGYFDPCPIHGKHGPDGRKIVWPTDKPVYINPPYSDPYPWVQRAVHHPGPVCLLLPVTPDSEWWQRFSRFFRITLMGDEMRFLRYVDGQQQLLEGVAPPKQSIRYGAKGGATRLYVSWWRRDGTRSLIRDPEARPETELPGARSSPRNPDIVSPIPATRPPGTRSRPGSPTSSIE